MQGGDEGEGDGLPALVPRFGAGSVVGQAVEEEVGIGLEPHHIPHPGRLRRVGGENGPVHLRSPTSGSPCVEAATGGDPVQPGPDRGTALESPEATPRGQQGLLQRILGILDRSEHPVTVHLQLAPVGIGELGERRTVSVPGHADQIRRHGAILSSPLLPAPRAAVVGRSLYRRRTDDELGGSRAEFSCPPESVLATTGDGNSPAETEEKDR